MTSHSKRFIDLVRSPQTLDFARQILTQSYMECAPGQEEAMRQLMDRAFTLLQEASTDEVPFQAALQVLLTDVFRKGDPDFWFNHLYRSYRQDFKPNSRFQQLQPLLEGQTVLDLGCGDGRTSLVIQENGYRPSLTDVLDYRAEAARSLPFQLMSDPRVIPYPDHAFDTAVVMAVLHHVDEADLLPLLAELHRTSRRAVIEEDSYDLPENLPGLPETLAGDEQLRCFLSLPQVDQLHYLMFLDYFANAITLGLPQMHMPFHFHTVSEWQVLFTGQGFRVEQILVKGFRKGYFNRSCHVWFVLNRI
jgi:SAM-dependent methyltransferase